MLVVNGIRSCCVLPLITAQGPGLHFGSRTPYAYSGEDDEFMVQVSRQVAVAADNALNSEAARVMSDWPPSMTGSARCSKSTNAVVTCLGGKQLFQAISASLREALSRPKGS